MKRLFASDFDGTLVPDKPADVPVDDREEFREVLNNQPELTFACITGRHFSLALEGLKESGLPLPRYLVCNVGTEIFWRKEASWEQDGCYQELLTRKFPSELRAQLEAFARTLPGVTLQESEKQSALKLSFYLDDSQRIAELENQVQTFIERNGLPTEAIFSHRLTEEGGHLDFLPEDTSKKTAVAYLREKLALEQNAVVYSGDSGNDLAVFLSGTPSIVVANASEDVKEAVLKKAQADGFLEQIFFAPSAHLRGVLEGLQHFSL